MTDRNTYKILTDLYSRSVGQSPESVKKLCGSGSNRNYYRLTGPQVFIGVIGESIGENKAFIELSKHFDDKCIPVPKIVAVSDDYTAYLQEDLGETLLFDCIASGRATGRFSKTEEMLLNKTICRLPEIQFIGAVDLDFGICYPLAEFNRRTVMWDLNYFKYCFLKTSGIDFNENDLEDDFERLADKLLEKDSNTFMYRDFQSRNVMIKDNEPWFIDFQGGRKGPVYYDVASFLWQARANIPADIRNHLIDVYLDSASRFEKIDRKEFKATLRHFVLFRLMQVLGAYGFRGRFERKLHFIESIIPALEKLDELLTVPFTDYPVLTEILHRMIAANRNPYPKRNHLVVTITSFSYKRGIPDDKSGNGGGFVFDCRAIHNPGRYDKYKKLTGLDREVIDFLKEREDVKKFLAECQNLVDDSVTTYLQRGFTDLMVNFGCTGGQHRSVYCAEAMAHHINEKFGIEVHVYHREQQISSSLLSINTSSAV